MNYFNGNVVYGDNVYVDEYYFDEKWTFIPGFPDYKISNKARVWSIKSQCFVKPKPMDNHGHLGVCLYRNGERYYKYIHRLVAEAFIPNPNNLPVVRHVYDIPAYNETEDLLWGTHKDNNSDAISNGRAYIPTDDDRRKGNLDKMMAIIAIDTRTGEEIQFESQGSAARSLHIPQANIWKVLNGQRYSAGGYVFKEVI